MFRLLVLSIIFKLVSCGGDSFDPASSFDQFIARKLDTDSEASADDEVFTLISADASSDALWVNQAGAAVINLPEDENSQKKIKKRKKFVMKPPGQ